MMKPVRLSTREGEYVTTVRIPAMNRPPDAIMWGQRMFMHISADHYSEGMLYVVPDMKVQVDHIPEAEKNKL